MSLRLALRALAGLLLVLGVFPLANVLTGGRAVPWFSGAALEWAERGVLLLGSAGLMSWALGDRLDAALA